MFLRRFSNIFRKNTKKILSYIFLSAMFFMFSWWINISNISNYNQNTNSNLETLNLEISFDSYKVYATDRFSSPTLISALWINSSTPQTKTSQAKTPQTNPQTNDSWTNKDFVKWAKIWNWVVAWISAILWVWIYLATLLLDPWFTSWTSFWINTKLHAIWILVSNVVYFIFAFLLIWIAFMNIIWKWDKWELKQAMPKFIVWVLIVPFSWFFVNLVVSLANILTFSALALPGDTFSWYETVLNKIPIPTTCTLDLHEWAKEWLKCDPKMTKDGGTPDNNLWQITHNSVFWLLMNYSYWLLHVDTLPTIDTNNIATWVIKSVEDMIRYLLFSWIFILVYGILIITLIIVLIVRAVWLWIYLALSPLFWLAYFFWKDWGGDLMKKFNVSEFIWLAMVPVYTVLALSFWFLFLHMTMTWMTAKSSGTSSQSNMKIDKNGINIDLWNGHNSKLIVKWWWAFANLLVDWKSAFKAVWDIWDSQLWFVGTIFMNIFWVVVFRIAIMAALQASTITKAIVAPIKQFGDSVWSLVSKAPTYAPVFGGQSMQSMSNIASSAQTYYTSTLPSKSASKFMWDHNLFWNKWELTSAIADLKQVVSWNKTVNQDILDKANEAMKKAWNANNARQQKDLVWQLKIIAGRLDVSKNIIENWWKNKDWYLKLLKAIDLKVENWNWRYWEDFLKNFKAQNNWWAYPEGSYNATYNAKSPQDISVSPKIEQVSKNYDLSTWNWRINIWNNTINVKVDENWNVTWIIKSDEDSFAKYIIKNIHSENALKDFMGEVNINDTILYKAIEDYLYKDKKWNIYYVQNSKIASGLGYEKASIDDFKNKIWKKK